MQFEAYKNRTLDTKRPVKIYRNLNNKLLSVVQDGVVVGHVDSCVLKDAEFYVQPSGQKRCRQEECKNFHAYVKGMIKKYDSKEGFTKQHRIFYNPYKNDTFVDEGGAVIKKVSVIQILANGCMYYK